MTAFKKTQDYVCPDCGEKFRLKMTYQNHLTQKHKFKKKRPTWK